MYFFINYYFDNYFIFFTFIFFSLIISSLLVILPYFLSPKNILFEKLSPYECGFEPFSSGIELFDIHFIVVAILFLLFDFELLLVFPVILNYFSLVDHEPILVFHLFIFLLILIIAFFYEWKSGALTWPIFFSVSDK